MCHILSLVKLSLVCPLKLQRSYAQLVEHKVLQRQRSIIPRSKKMPLLRPVVALLLLAVADGLRTRPLEPTRRTLLADAARIHAFVEPDWATLERPMPDGPRRPACGRAARILISYTCVRVTYEPLQFVVMLMAQIVVSLLSLCRATRCK